MSTQGEDRREFLRKAGLGAVAAGAWVAPQVLSTATASAACTAIPKLLQIDAAVCPSNAESMTTFDPDISCAPTDWVAGLTEGVAFSCSSLTGNPAQGSTITISGCTPTEAFAVKYCPSGSGTGLTCQPGTIVGNQVTFSLTGAEISASCVFLDYRITVSCCT